MRRKEKQHKIILNSSAGRHLIKVRYALEGCVLFQEEEGILPQTPVRAAYGLPWWESGAGVCVYCSFTQ